MANSQASSIISYSVNICKIDGNQSGITALADTDMLAMLNRANNEFIEAPYQSGGTSWDFMKAETGYTLTGDTSLSATLLTTDGTATVADNTNLTDNAAVVYSSGNPDIFEFSGTSGSTLLTGVTGVGFTHSSGDSVIKLYKLPSNFGKFKQQELYGDGVRVSGNAYFFSPEDPQGYRFSMYDNGTNKWTWFPRNSSGFASIIYDKAATSITANSSYVDVPVKYELFLIYRLVEHVKRVLQYDGKQIEEARKLADSILLTAMKQRNISKRPRLVRRTRSTWFSVDGKTVLYAT